MTKCTGRGIAALNPIKREGEHSGLFIQFYGIWGLYLGAEKKPLDGGSLDKALAQMEDEFGPLLRQKLKEQGVRLDGDISKHSFITVNDKYLRQLACAQLKESDVLHVFPAITGG